ncbi:MAG: SPOR domain-containing protein [Bacteroidota bacterium]
MQYWLLAVLMSLGTELAPTDPPLQGSEKQYYKYEREEVSLYRDRSDFSLPDVETPVENPEPVLPKGRSVAPYFSEGNQVYIEADGRLETLVNRHIAINKKIRTLSGFRVQVFAGSSRSSALRMKQRLMILDVPSYLDYKTPNYVVRVGDFLEKEDAILFSRDIRKSFPGAFVVPDQVAVPKYKEPEAEDDMEGENRN